MELGITRGGSKQDLLDKKYRIAVGISLGNKWFTPANIVEATKWSLAHTKDLVIVYVADTIHAINLEVRNRISSEKALRIAKEKGEALLQEVKAELKEVESNDDFNRIHFTTWDGLLTESYREKVSFLYTLY